MFVFALVGVNGSTFCGVCISVVRRLWQNSGLTCVVAVLRFARYTSPLKETLTKMLSGSLSFDAFPSLLPMPQEVCTMCDCFVCVRVVLSLCGTPSSDLIQYTLARACRFPA